MLHLRHRSLVKLVKIGVHPTIGVARVVDWGGGGGAKPQITCNGVVRNFQKRNFLWGKDIVEWKIRSRDLVWQLTRISLEGFNQNSKSENV